MWKFLYKNCEWLSVVWAMIILGLCSTPGQYVPSISWLEILSFDKWVHASIFFILSMFLLSIAIKKNLNNLVVGICFFLSVVYGGALEIMQAYFFSNRSADWQDFIANSFGCVVALALFGKLKRKFQNLDI
ncbi:MAG: VanZ family protein [Bacteroidetes bacterium]|jgi:VanZ family protein|nr:VanZ family protein [Bacteroidota bacterium]